MSHRWSTLSTELGWWRAWTWQGALQGGSDTPSLGTWGCGGHGETPSLSGVGCLGVIVLCHRSHLQFPPGGQEKALWGGVMVLFSARSRGRGEVCCRGRGEVCRRDRGEVCRRGRGEGEERREREAGTWVKN